MVDSAITDSGFESFGDHGHVPLRDESWLGMPHQNRVP